MVDNIGRNDPCPCGSGKKYKKCCLSKEREGRTPAPLDQSVPQEPMALSPQTSEDAQDGPWERFEAGEYEDQIAIYLAQLKSGSLDEDFAFEMVSRIHPQARKRGEYARFAELVECLKREQPRLYSSDIGYYNLFLIENEISQGRAEKLPELVSAYAEIPHRHIDTFFRVIYLLMYHGHTEPLIAAMTRAWPKVFTSSEIMPWGVEEFRVILTQLLIFDYVDRTKDPEADDPVLRKTLQPFSEMSPEWLEQIVRHLSRQEGRAWNVSDFEVEMDGDQRNEQLFLLSFDFLSELRWSESIPFSKGEVGRSQLLDYLLCEEHVEEIDEGIAILYPRQDPLDCFLGQLFDRQPGLHLQEKQPK